MMEIWEKHPEVYHYTTFQGFKGILESQTLFATRYDCLNDGSEFRLLRESLPELLRPMFTQRLRELWKVSPEVKREIRNSGGIEAASRQLAGELGTIHFDAAFGEVNGRPPITRPYITSFCDHPNEDSYERRHGLLSQWRAYGQDGGLAIVFDTERLWQHCMMERETYAYAMIMFDDVVYDGDDEAFSRELGPAIELIAAELDEILRNGPKPGSHSKEDAGKIISSFARLKHRAFREETEVRIVACPVTPEAQPTMASNFEEYRNAPIKYPRDPNAAKPQIELFDFNGAGQLPISRIIVGPQEQQVRALKLAERLVAGMSIQVDASETPLVQQH